MMARNQKPGGYIDLEELAEIDDGLAQIETDGLRLIAGWPSGGIDAAKEVARLVMLAQASRVNVRNMRERRAKWRGNSRTRKGEDDG